MSVYSNMDATVIISKPPMLSLLSNVGNHTDIYWTVKNLSYSSGEELVEILGCTTTTVDDMGMISVVSTTGEPMVCDLLESILCPLPDWTIADASGLPPKSGSTRHRTLQHL